MRPRNFPERVNRRRKVALVQLESQRLLIAGNPSLDLEHIEEYHAKALKEAEILRSRIVPSARHIRTKKNRAGSVVGAKTRRERIE